MAVTLGRARLSQIVNESGISAFTKDDFYLVSGGVSQDPGRLVLVGGQAIETWGVLLNVRAPTGDQHPLTEDTDWLGSAADAQWLADFLGRDNTVELTKATLDDNTPNTAVMLLQRADQRILLMDFLHSITGLSNQEINKMAVSLEVPDLHGKTYTLRVLHPLHCLQSRMANLQTHSSKRDGNGPLQAQWAVNIMHAYLQQIAVVRPSDQLAKACRELATVSMHGPAEYCYTHYGLEPIVVVTPEILEATGPQFSELEWPHLLKRFHVKKARWQSTQLQLQRRKRRAS